MGLFAEMRRRNVFKVAFVYLFGAALAYWLSVVVQTQLGLPWWTSRLIALLLCVGFPAALIFAWVYEITPSGLKKAIDVDQTQSIVFKTGQKLNAALAVVIVLGAVAMVADRLLPELAVVEPPPPPAPEIASFTLTNGLRVIVWPDHDIPNVALYLYVRAGGRNEVPGITGLSHFFEHMMFNGTATRAPGEFDRVMEAAGGANNAYTTNDVTVYTDWFPRSALETVFELEADRFENLAIVPDVVETERGVVYSERRTRVDNDNTGKLYEQVLATAYVAHPYQFPVIGWPSDIEAWTLGDLEDYFRTYYAPNNCTLVVTGDVTAEEIHALATDRFGAIPAQDPPPPVRTVEPPQSGMRRVTVEAPAQTPLLHVAFHAGRTADPDSLPTDLLLNILVGGDSSRLHRLLVEEEQLAISVGGFRGDAFDPGLVYLYLTLPPGADPAAVEARLFGALASVADDGVTEAELAKARNIMLADFWRGMATINGKASALGDFEVFHGDYARLFDRAADIGRIFRGHNATVGVFLPAADEGEAP